MSSNVTDCQDSQLSEMSSFPQKLRNCPKFAILSKLQTKIKTRQNFYFPQKDVYPKTLHQKKIGKMSETNL